MIDYSLPVTSDTEISQNSGNGDWVKIKTDPECFGWLPRGWPVARVTWVGASEEQMAHPG